MCGVLVLTHCVCVQGNRFVSAGGDPTINVYDSDTVARIATMEFGGSVNDLCCTPDERLLFAAGTERDIKAYNLRTLKGDGGTAAIVVEPMLGISCKVSL
jgi:WD40 repeat protein